jgi:hypothetical protein
MERAVSLKTSRDDAVDMVSLMDDQTREIRDQIASLTAQVVRTGAERDAAKDRARRASAEVAKQRALEEELKKSRDAAADMVAETQRLLEELDRKRRETLDFLNRCQEGQKSLTQSLWDAQAHADQALAEAEAEQENEQNAEAEISKLLEDRRNREADLRGAILESLDIFLEQQADRVLSAFASEERRQELMRDYESLQETRRSDPHVGSLCEQREELNKFLSAATVPAVKNTLQVSLKTVEDELRGLFPGAFQLEDFKQSESQTEELLYYLGADGHVVFTIPAKTSHWEAAQEEEVTDNGTKAMRIAWDMIRDLRLKEQDGDFVMTRGRPVFESRFDAKEVAVRQGFTIKYGETDILRFTLVRIPREVEEALTHEE